MATEDQDKKDTTVQETSAEPENAGAAPSTEPPPVAESQGADGELEEGWPKTWIVTTAILGIVAIIIVARLVGQTWRKDAENPPPPPVHEQPAAKADRPPPKAGRPEPKVAAQHPRPAGEEPSAGESPVQRRVLLQGTNLTVPPGLSCLSRDGKLVALKDMDGKPESCLQEAPNPLNLRLEAERTEPRELSLMLMPAAGATPVLANTFFPPFDAKTYFVAVSTGKLKYNRVLAVVRHPNKDAIKLAALRLVTTDRFQDGVRHPQNAYSFENITINKKGSFCIGNDKSLVSYSGKGMPPAACELKAAGATTYDIAVSGTGNMSELNLRLIPYAPEVPPLLEVQLMTPEAGNAEPQHFSIKTGPMNKVALAFNGVEGINVKLTRLTLKTEHLR